MCIYYKLQPDDFFRRTLQPDDLDGRLDYFWNGLAAYRSLTHPIFNLLTTWNL